MATITKEQYVEQLRAYVMDELQALNENEKPKGLRANVEFNKEKAKEFAAILAAEGTTIE